MRLLPDDMGGVGIRAHFLEGHLHTQLDLALFKQHHVVLVNRDNRVAASFIRWV